jgi:hypothetical protein
LGLKIYHLATLEEQEKLNFLPATAKDSSQQARLISNVGVKVADPQNVDKITEMSIYIHNLTARHIFF